MRGNTMRLLAVLELLQSRSEITGREIAQQLDVDARSVRRYIKSLQDMGIPIEGERGRYGAYRLDGGFKIPPMMFTEEEAVALTLGLMTIRAFQFPIATASIAGALAKIERVLPEKLLNRSRAVQETVHFQYTWAVNEADRNIMIALSIAVQNQQRLCIHYRSWQGEVTKRHFDPYGIAYYEGFWYAAGYCHLRENVRTFRVDRMQQVEFTQDWFVHPPDFNTLQVIIDSLGNPPNIASVSVLFETTLDVAERSIPAELGTLEPVDGGVLFRRPAYRLDWVAGILLSVDFPIRIIEPPELVDIIRDLGEKALRLLKNK